MNTKLTTFKRASVSFLLTVIIFSLYTNTCNAQNSCVEIQYASNCQDFVIAGATAEHTLFLNNNTDSDISVTDAVISGSDSDVFSISSSLPLQVPAHSQNTALNYNFTPANSLNTVVEAALALTVSGNSISCTSIYWKLLGQVQQTKVDANGNNIAPTIQSLFPTEKHTLAIESNGPNGSVVFRFKNNLTVDATINSISLNDGTNFSATPVAPLTTPFTVHPGDNFSAKIVFSGKDKLIHYDKLMIDANHQILPVTFDLEGINAAPAASVAELPAGVNLMLSPNPSHGNVTFVINGIRSSKISLLNVLGKPCATAATDGTWVWDASHVAPGSYVAKITGVAEDGTQFDASRIINIVK
jgi:hypothetical protein